MKLSLFFGLGVVVVPSLAQIGIQDVLNSWGTGPYANYPTQFTRDIIPVRLWLNSIDLALRVLSLFIFND